MAKSMRSKVKKTARRLKREEGTYAVHDAARVARLNTKLLKNNSSKDEIATSASAEDKEGEEVEEEVVAEGEDADAAMAPAAPAKISTSGPRGNRRELWRASKGMATRTTTNGMNSKGKIIGSRKAGRPSRRR